MVRMDFDGFQTWDRMQYLSAHWHYLYFRYKIDVWWIMKMVVYWWDKENDADDDADDDHHWSLWSCSKWFHVSDSGIRCLILLPKKTLVCKGSKLYRGILPCRELTSPTWRKGTSSSKVPLKGDMLVPWRVLVWFWKIHWNDGPKWKWYWCLLNHQLKPSHGWHWMSRNALHGSCLRRWDKNGWNISGAGAVTGESDQGSIWWLVRESQSMWWFS